ncbi:MAG: hypothetical protein A2X32_02080 [Elusimicrobia bacterium GWC2_64_44]|nr:MAG: hypothetical protein A2X32_02080 [Elusimicrobia bacterium GWC2_64_44]
MTGAAPAAPLKPALLDLAGLAKPPISFLAGSAAALGCAACLPGRASAALGAGFGVFLLSAGACTLNNWQDRDIDGAETRTRGRPLPSGRLRPGAALAQAALLLAAGLACLALVAGSYAAPLAGALAVLLYNAAYTPLKRRTLLALAPGLLCGALPPLVGWLAAGGTARPGLIYLMILFGAWQLPHLWLILLSGAGVERRLVPSFLDRFAPEQLRRMTAAWVAAFAFLTLFLRVFGFVGGAAVLPLAANALLLPLVFLRFLGGGWTPAKGRGLSLYLTLSMLGVTLLAAAATLRG